MEDYDRPKQTVKKLKRNFPHNPTKRLREEPLFYIKRRADSLPERVSEFDDLHYS